MDRWERTQVWAPLAALGAMAIGIALIPLREATSASNLAFVFMAFTIVMAELGGALSALVAALVSAMSLNFFLTEPYLTLAISKTDDLIAFLALAGCGLIAAAFGARRERWSRAARREGRTCAPRCAARRAPVPFRRRACAHAPLAAPDREPPRG